ncbi:MAG: anthranilate synthase component I family protein [Halobacteria archaeon]
MTEEPCSRAVERNVDPLEVFDTLDAEILLEKGERGWKETYVAADPVSRYRKQVDSDDQDVLGGFRDWLQDELPDIDSDTGAYGFVGYPVSREIEEIKADAGTNDLGIPDIAFGIYDTVVIIREDEYVVETIDHPRRKTKPGVRNKETVCRLETVSDDSGNEVSERLSGDLEHPEPGSLKSNFDEEGYCEAVSYVKDRIRDGETFQANISQRLEFETELGATELYRKLRRVNPSPYMGIMDWDEFFIVSCSPELLVKKRGDVLRTRPIAGTRPRGRGSGGKEREEGGDCEGRNVDAGGHGGSNHSVVKDLVSSGKDRAEHAILVDLERNDLGKVSRYGTVEVESYMKPTVYQEVIHLESVVEGLIREGVDAVDVLKAMFPGGTVTGAPKPRTLKIINEVEPCSRGPYTGSMGRFSCNGELTLNILIRTLVGTGEKTYLQVGGGVVHDSVPENEYRETLDKTRGVLNALDTDWIE